MNKTVRENISRTVVTACAALLIISMAAIIYFIGSNAYQTFTQYHQSLGDFFLGEEWDPASSGLVGARYLIIGSILVTLLAVLISTPISIGVAVFITEVAPTWMRNIMQPVLELFLGIPSIVYGILALLILVPIMRTVTGGPAGIDFTGYGFITASLVLAIMILPTITTITVDAVRALPVGMREASLALGATRWQTIRKTLIPAASSGIFTGIILGMGRAIGETLAISFVIGGQAGNFPIKFVDYSPYVLIVPSSTITVQLLFSFKEAVNPSLTYSAIWTLSFVLLLISLILVIASRWVGSRSALSTTTRPRRSLRSLFRSASASSETAAAPVAATNASIATEGAAE